MIFLIISLAILFFITFRFIEISGTYDDYCVEKYGNHWFYENNEYFGKFCVEIDNITFNTKYREEIPTTEEIADFCETPNFLSFEKRIKCKGEKEK